MCTEAVHNDRVAVNVRSVDEAEDTRSLGPGYDTIRLRSAGEPRSAGAGGRTAGFIAQSPDTGGAGLNHLHDGLFLLAGMHDQIPPTARS
jgi:hypothetical protein